MSVATRFAEKMAEVPPRPTFSLNTPNGPIPLAFVDVVVEEGKARPVLVLEKCVLTVEGFAEMMDWVGKQFVGEGDSDSGS